MTSSKPARTPSEHREIVDAWRRAAPANDNKVLPRKAQPKGQPRHADLADRLRPILIWRSTMQSADWTSVAANDNHQGDNEQDPALLDSEHEVRPRVGEMMRMIRGVTCETRRDAKLGGGGTEHVVPVGGDMARGPVLSQRGKPDCVTRLGSMRFSNGRQTERALIRTETGLVRANIEIPIGGLVDWNSQKPRDRFSAAKGESGDIPWRRKGTTSPAAMAWNDPVEDAEELERVRALVPEDVAEILDIATTAANFRQIGEHLGFAGKNAERRGKAALVNACDMLDAALRAA